MSSDLIKSHGCVVRYGVADVSITLQHLERFTLESPEENFFIN